MNLHIFRNARYERRIAALEARVAELVRALNSIGPTAIEAAARSDALWNLWSAQSDLIPGEERPKVRGALVN